MTSIFCYNYTTGSGKMFNRTLMVVSISLMVIILLFNVIIFGYTFSKGLFENYRLTTFGICYLIFLVVVLIGIVLSIIAYKRKNFSLLFLGTLSFLIASLPALGYGLSNPSAVKSPFLLTQFVLPSLALNIIQIILLKRGITNTKIGLDKLLKK
jgi:hypothetical protein